MFNLKSIKRIRPAEFSEQKANLTIVGEEEDVRNTTDENDCVLDLEYESDNDEDDEFESDEEMHNVSIDDSEVQVNFLQASYANRKKNNAWSAF